MLSSLGRTQGVAMVQPPQPRQPTPEPYRPAPQTTTPGSRGPVPPASASGSRGRLPDADAAAGSRGPGTAAPDALRAGTTRSAPGRRPPGAATERELAQALIRSIDELLRARPAGADRLESARRHAEQVVNRLARPAPVVDGHGPPPDTALDAARSVRDRLAAEERTVAAEFAGPVRELHAEARRLCDLLGGKSGGERTTRPPWEGRPGPRSDGRSAAPRMPVEPEPPRPEIKPVAWLHVAAPAHGRVRAWGLGSFVRAHDIRAQDSTAVVTANDCTLNYADHYHIRRVSFDLDTLQKDAGTWTALLALVRDPDDAGAQDRFRRRLCRLVEPVHEPDDAVHREQISSSVTARVRSCEVVQQGDGSRLDATTNYHLRVAEIPLAEVLHAHPELVAPFAAALRPDRAPGRLDDVVARILDRAGDPEDATLLRHARDLLPADTATRSLFGHTRVDRAAAVMVGTGNVMNRATRVDHASLRARDLRTELDRLRPKAAARVEPDRTVRRDPGPERPPSPVRARLHRPEPGARKDISGPDIGFGR
jgi:hypothetical protein